MLLDETSVKAALAGLSDWQIDDQGRLARAFKFRTFNEAFGFMTRVALLAE
ncbi:MAG: 4a-hydroxytetrahydrobiopterin dehydratase, partial [Pseudomonadota bacterium]